jgi:predicted N-acetyltransferase YhbS
MNDNGDFDELIIRTVRKEDYSRITEVTDLAFMRKEEGILVASLRRNPDQKNWSEVEKGL